MGPPQAAQGHSSVWSARLTLLLLLGSTLLLGGPCSALDTHGYTHDVFTFSDSHVPVPATRSGAHGGRRLLSWTDGRHTPNEQPRPEAVKAQRRALAQAAGEGEGNVTEVNCGGPKSLLAVVVKLAAPLIQPMVDQAVRDALDVLQAERGQSAPLIEFDDSASWDVCTPRVCLPWGGWCIGAACVDVGASVRARGGIRSIAFEGDAPVALNITTVNCTDSSTWQNLSAASGASLGFDRDAVRVRVFFNATVEVNGLLRNTKIPVNIELGIAVKGLSVALDAAVQADALLDLFKGELAFRAAVTDVYDFQFRFDDIDIDTETILDGPVNNVEKLVPKLTERVKDSLFGTISDVVKQALNDQATGNNLVFEDTLNLTGLAGALGR